MSEMNKYSIGDILANSILDNGVPEHLEFYGKLVQTGSNTGSNHLDNIMGWTTIPLQLALMKIKCIHQ